MNDPLTAIIEPRGQDIVCRFAERPSALLTLPGSDPVAQYDQWIARYRTAARSDSQSELLDLGREIFDYIEHGGWASHWLSLRAPRLEVRVSSASHPMADRLLSVPWELLATPGGYLADIYGRSFEVVRRIGEPVRSPGPAFRDLRMIFMAAAPEGERLLSFEAEEAAILSATRRLPLQLVVEESGNAASLTNRLESDGTFDVVHLSCHGGFDADLGNILSFEDVFGGKELVTAETLGKSLGSVGNIKLVFISACQGTASVSPDYRNGSSVAEPLFRTLVTAGIPNVLGWDGSVYEADATFYAEVFYEKAAEGATVPFAASSARAALRQLNTRDPERGRHWHLARLYTGPSGGLPLISSDGATRPRLESPELQFLDGDREEVPIARAHEFVGRRRQLQAALRFMRDGRAVLLSGMGNLGKSSLAARIASRLNSLRTVVIFGDYRALSIFERLYCAVSQENLDGWPRAEWAESIRRNPAALQSVLEALLNGPLRETPVLLVIDDLEQILQAPVHSAPTFILASEHELSIRAVITAFGKGSSSRLLLTSRYVPSVLGVDGRNLIESFAHVPLTPLGEIDARKLVRAAASEFGARALGEKGELATERALGACSGNPGLLRTLLVPILGGDLVVAAELLDVVDSFKESGRLPAVAALEHTRVAHGVEGLAEKFFRRMRFDTYRDSLGASDTAFLQCCCLFSVGLPIPEDVVQAVAAAVGIFDNPSPIVRLTKLGVLSDWSLELGARYISIDPLARPLVSDFAAEQVSALASIALPPLYAQWRRVEAPLHWGRRAREMCRVALLCVEPDPEILQAVAFSSSAYLFYEERNASTALHATILPSMKVLGRYKDAISMDFWSLALTCAEWVGSTAASDEVISRMEQSEPSGKDKAIVLCHSARRDYRTGNLAEAERSYRKAAAIFQSEGHEQLFADAMSGVADVLEVRGEWDTVREIRLEIEIPVAEKYHNWSSYLIATYKLLEILQANGDNKQAIQILRDQLIPAYEDLEDEQQLALANGRLADFLERQGDVQESLALREADELPVFRRLGHLPEAAIAAGKIADLKEAMGDWKEAERIRKQEQIPIFEELNNLRETAITKGKMAASMGRHGQAAEAIGMLRDEVIPAFDKLGDARFGVQNRVHLAGIYFRLDRVSQAAALFRDEISSMVERLDEPEAILQAYQLLAAIYRRQGQRDRALQLVEKCVGLAAEIGDATALLIAKSDRASICLEQRGLTPEALAAIRADAADALAEASRVARPDLVGSTGLILADVFARLGETGNALAVLDTAESGFTGAEDAAQIANVRRIRQQMLGRL